MVKKYDIFPNGLAIQWADNTESFLGFHTLRNACPCAYCSGETDVFGNVYIGKGIRKTQAAYEVNRVEKVGHYAIRFFWKDNHNSGIYSFELLKKLTSTNAKN